MLIVGAPVRGSGEGHVLVLLGGFIPPSACAVGRTTRRCPPPGWYPRCRADGRGRLHPRGRVCYGCRDDKRWLAPAAGTLRGTKVDGNGAVGTGVAQVARLAVLPVLPVKTPKSRQGPNRGLAAIACGKGRSEASGNRQGGLDLTCVSCPRANRRESGTATGGGPAACGGGSPLVGLVAGSDRCRGVFGIRRRASGAPGAPASRTRPPSSIPHASSRFFGRYGGAVHGESMDAHGRAQEEMGESRRR